MKVDLTHEELMILNRCLDHATPQPGTTNTQIVVTTVNKMRKAIIDDILEKEAAAKKPVQVPAGMEFVPAHFRRVPPTRGKHARKPVDESLKTGKRTRAK